MVAHEVGMRMGRASEHDAALGLTTIDNGQLVVVVPWSQMLAQVHGCLDESGDTGGLANLAQLRGLCDRADSEAMLPIHDSELGSEIARRLYDFQEIVDAVTDELLRRWSVSVRGLRAVGGKGYYGRSVSSLESGHVIQLSFLTWSWANRFPTPFWLRVWQPSAEVVAAWQRLEGTPGVVCIDATTSRDRYLQIGLAVPTGVEEDRVVARIADVVESAIAALPPATRGAEAEPTLASIHR